MRHQGPLVRRPTRLVLLLCAASAGAWPASARAGLNTTNVWSVNGVGNHYGLGYCVAAAGDVNGDGYADILVSNRMAVNGSHAVYLYLGSANGPVFPAAWKYESYQIEAHLSAAGDVNGDGYDDVVFGFAQLPPAPAGGLVEVRYGHPWGLNDVPEFSESFPGSTGGYSVSAAGDVNGDGYDDVAVGDPTYGGAAAPCQHVQEGRLIVYYGSTSGLSEGNSWRRCGYPANQDGAMAGRTFAGIGDVNGDGYDDVACTYSSGTTWSRVLQFLGSASGLSTAFPDGIYGPPSSNDPDFGHVIAPAGDVNGDGYADVIIGDPHYGAAGSDSGAVYIVPGNATYGMSWSGIIDIGGVVVSLSTLHGPAGSQLGESAFTAGDINGDGLADIIVGAPMFSSPEAGEGMFGVSLSTKTAVTPLQPPIQGDTPSVLLGWSVSAAGDVNGDGYGDVIVGAPGFGPGVGQARVYFGAPEKPVASASATRYGGHASDLGGWAVAAGDVNGDGFDDVLMGAPYGDAGQVDVGFVSLYLGKPGGIDATPAWTAAGPSPGSNFGVAAAMGLDVNGDGLGDILVGANLDNGVGSLSVFHGRAAWSGSSTTPDAYLQGSQSGAQFASTVAFAGDVDGDGFADVLVGVPYQNQGLNAVGAVRLYKGSSGGLITTPSWSSVGTQTDEHRYSAASAGDVNGDGYSDVIVGAEGFDDGALTDAGRALVYLGGPAGVSTTPQQEWHGESAGSVFGHSVAGTGDMDGDGWGEVAVGAYGYGGTGKIYVFRGSSAGSDPGTTTIWTVTGPQAGAGFGFTVAGAGDVNGDGRSDLLVGSVFQDGAGGTDCGRAYVFAGPYMLSSFADFAGPSSFANMGHAIAAGDVNGDGFGDLVFGEPRLAQTQFDEGGFQLYLGNMGFGRPRPTYLTQPLNAIPVALYGRSPSNTSVGFYGEAFSPGGRDRIAFDWAIDPILAGITPQRGRTPFVMTGPPTGPDGGAISFQQQVGFLISNSVYAWRSRILSKSPYFRFGPWISPQPNARGQWDIRTAPRTTDVPIASTRAHGSLRASPNPAEPRTRITFALASGGDATLVIRDVGGRVVRRLASGWRSAGDQQVDWDGRDETGRSCPPGVYFVAMRSGSDRQLLRLTLLR